LPLPAPARPSSGVTTSNAPLASLSVATLLPTVGPWNGADPAVQVAPPSREVYMASGMICRLKQTKVFSSSWAAEGW
jgi:hypothetical protein